MKKVTLLICLLFLLTLPVQAETVEEKLNPTKNDAPTTQQVDESPSMALTIFKGVVVLVVLIGGFILVTRFIHERTRGVRHSGRLTHLGGVPLGKDRSVQLVKVQDKIYVVGVGENVQLLDTLDDLEGYEPTDLEEASSKSSPSPFLETFKQQLEQLQKNRGRS